MGEIETTPAATYSNHEIAASLTSMIIEWVDGGVKFGTNWKPGLRQIIEARLDRMAPANAAPASPRLLAVLKECQSVLATLRDPKPGESTVHVVAAIVAAETKARSAIKEATST